MAVQYHSPLMLCQLLQEVVEVVTVEVQNAEWAVERSLVMVKTDVLEVTEVDLVAKSQALPCSTRLVEMSSTMVGLV